MEDLIYASAGGVFKIFGLGFLAGGLFSFAVSLVADWLSDREQQRNARMSKHNIIK